MELLRLVDDDLVDAELGNRHHVVLAALQGLEALLEAFLHPLDPLAGEPVLAVQALEPLAIALQLSRISWRSNSTGVGSSLKALWVTMVRFQSPVAARGMKRRRLGAAKLVSSATRMLAVG